MNKFFDNFKLVITNCIASMLTYVVIIICLKFEIYPLTSFQLFEDEFSNDTFFSLSINLLVVTISFALCGILSKEKNIKQIVIFIIYNVFWFVMLLLFDGSFVNYLLIPLDSLLVYCSQFIFYRIYQDYFSIIVSFLISCIFPTAVFLIFGIKRKNILKEYRE